MDDSLRVLVVGVGSIGERHVRCFQTTGQVRLAVCDVNARLRDDVADRYGLDETYGDLAEALASDFDAAVICTPAHLHIPMAIELASRGCHLLIEKPLSTNRDGLDQLRAAVRDARVKVMIAYVLRCHPALVDMKRALDAGRFGRPVQVIAYSGQHFPTYRPAYRDIYYRARTTGGGAIQDALTHMIDAGQWLVGPVNRLTADCAHQVLDGVEVEDTVNVLARHGELLASYTLNQHQAPNESTLTVVCEAGTVRFEGHLGRWRWMTDPGGSWLDEPCEALERDDLFVAQAHRFLDCLGGTAEPSCSLEGGVQTLDVNLAVLQSSAEGTWIDLPSSS